MKIHTYIIKSIILLTLLALLFSLKNVNAAEYNESVSDNQFYERTEKDDNLLVEEEYEIEGNEIDSGWSNDIYWSLDSNGALSVTGHGDLARWIWGSDDTGTPWNKYRDQIRSLYVDVYDVNDAGYWFYKFSNLQSVKIARMDMSETRSSNGACVAYLFAGCSSLEKLDLEGMDTSCVTDMMGMFVGCRALSDLNISCLNTAKVERMNSMFMNCRSLSYLSLSNWRVDNVKDMESMFDACISLQKIDLEGWNTKNLNDMNSMFENCVSLQTLDLSHFDTSNVTTMFRLFFGCHNLCTLDICGWNTEKVENMSSMFETCWSLQILDLSHFDTSNVTDTQGMFYHCYSLRYLDISNFDYSNVVSSFYTEEFASLGKLEVFILPANFNITLKLPFLKYENKDRYHYIDSPYYGPDGQIHDTAITGLPYKAVYSIYPNYTFIQGFASRMYTTVLNRPAELEGLHYWTMALVNQEVDGAGIAKGFIYSEEFKNRHLNNGDYVDVLYRTFFDRDPDAEGKNYWISLLNSGINRYFILSQFVNSQEFSEICSMYGINRGVMRSSAVNEKGVRDYVLRMYTKALDRAGEAEGVNYWSECIITAESTAEEVAKSFFHSQEFLNKNLSDPDYVETLYATYFDRVSDAEGKAYWLNQMQNGMSRDDVLTEFAYSREFKQIMSGYGL